MDKGKIVSGIISGLFWLLAVIGAVFVIFYFSAGSAADFLRGVPTPRSPQVDVFGSSSADKDLSTSTSPTVKDLEIGDSIDLVRLNLAYTPSTTGSTVDVEVGYSWDGTTFYGHVGGFAYSTTTADALSRFVLSNATSSLLFVPGSAERQFQSAEIYTNGARHLRLKISRGGNGAAASVNAQVWANAVLIDNR